MVLVDTSAWIQFLSNRAPYAGRLDALLVRGEVCGHDLVFGELLIGADPRLATVATELGINHG